MTDEEMALAMSDDAKMKLMIGMFQGAMASDKLVELICTGCGAFGAMILIVDHVGIRVKAASRTDSPGVLPTARILDESLAVVEAVIDGIMKKIPGEKLVESMPS